MTIEEKADLILFELYNKQMNRSELLNMFPDADSALRILTKDQYIQHLISREHKPPHRNYYYILPKGKQFHENGGFKAIRDYNQTILNTAKSSKTLALWAIGISVLSILVSLILWIAARGK